MRVCHTLKYLWTPWVGYGVALALLLLLCFRPPVKTENKIETREVVKWKIHETIRTLPGAVVSLGPDWTATIEGPVEITRSSEGDRQREEKVSVSTASCARYGVGGGLGTDLALVPHYGIIGTFNLAGPFDLAVTGTYPFTGMAYVMVRF